MKLNICKVLSSLQCRKYFLHMSLIKQLDDEIRCLKLLEKGPAKATVWRTKRFPVTPSVIKDNGYFIYSVPTREN